MPSLLQNTSMTGVSSGWAVGPAPPHTDWHCRLAQAATHTKGPFQQLCAQARPPQPAEARKGVPARRRDGTGHRLHQQPRPGRPQHSAWLRLLHLAGPQAAPAQGGGQLLLVPNPTGHTAIYLGVGPAPWPRPLSTSGKAALYAHLSLLRPGAPQQPQA